MVSKDLAGPVGLFVKFSVLQEYGVDRVFLLENGNVDSSQRNIIFLIHAEKPNHVQSAAGTYLQPPIPALYITLHLLFMVENRGQVENIFTLHGYLCFLD